MKIIKRTIAENNPTDTQTPAPSPNSQPEDGRGMVNVVKSWISERAANRQTEKDAAARSLFEWKTAALRLETSD